MPRYRQEIEEIENFPVTRQSQIKIKYFLYLIIFSICRRISNFLDGKKQKIAGQLRIIPGNIILTLSCPAYLISQSSHRASPNSKDVEINSVS